MTIFEPVSLEQALATPGAVVTPIDDYIAEQVRGLLADCHPVDYSAAFNDTLDVAVAAGDADPLATVLPPAYLPMFRSNVWRYREQRRAYERGLKGN